MSPKPKSSQRPGPRQPLQRSISKVKPDKSVTSVVLRNQLLRINSLASSWQRRLSKHAPMGVKSTIRSASDCSGYGSDLIAYKLLGLQSRVLPVMMSEVDANKVVLHHAVSEVCGFKTKSEASDMFLRKQGDMSPSDIYIAGYPCPSFSNLGQKKGVFDRRGLVTLKGLEYIAVHRPRVVILEQVKAILQKQHTKVWNYILKIFKEMAYEINYRVLDTRNFAVPQSRPRMYLLAVAREICCGEVALPEDSPDRVDLHWFLNKSVTGTESLHLPKYEGLLGDKMWSKGYILDVGSSEKFQSVMTNASPCLTKTRLQQAGYYIPKLRRRLLLQEAAALQGLPSQVLQAMSRAAEVHGLSPQTIQGKSF